MAHRMGLVALVMCVVVHAATPISRLGHSHKHSRFLNRHVARVLEDAAADGKVCSHSTHCSGDTFCTFDDASGGVCKSCALVSHCVKDVGTMKGQEACTMKCKEQGGAPAEVGHARCGEGEEKCGGRQFCDFNEGHVGVCKVCHASTASEHGSNEVAGCSEVSSDKGRKACVIKCEGASNGGVPSSLPACSRSSHCAASNFCTFSKADGSGFCRPCHDMANCDTAHTAKGRAACTHMCPAAGGEGAALGGGYTAEPPAAYNPPAYVAPAAPQPKYGAYEAHEKEIYKSSYIAQAHTTAEVEGCIDNYQWIRGLLGLLVICSTVNFIKGPNIYDVLLILFWMWFIEHLMCRKEAYIEANDYGSADYNAASAYVPPNRDYVAPSEEYAGDVAAAGGY